MGAAAGNFLTSLNRIWQRSTQFLVERAKVQVWKTHDRNGDHWHVFDPDTDRSISLSSEAETRMWIEQHYYH